eukprot:scaffold46168_cov47-Prasinocladus_malaysianus.AAC.1
MLAVPASAAPRRVVGFLSRGEVAGGHQRVVCLSTPGAAQREAHPTAQAPLPHPQGHLPSPPRPQREKHFSAFVTTLTASSDCQSSRRAYACEIT